MLRMCSTNGENEKRIQQFGFEPSGEGASWEN